MNSQILIPLSLGICRICVHATERHAMNLFSEKKESKEILDKIYSCFHITLRLDENLPSYICKNCIEELHVANSFRLKCLSFDEKFAICFTQTKNKAESCDSIEPLKNDMNSDDVLSDFSGETCNSNMVLDEPIKIKPNNDQVLNLPKVKKVSLISGDHNEFKCNICSKILRSELSLAKHYVCMHQKRKHIGRVSGCGATRRYHCTTCPYSTPHSQTLVNHIRRHDGVRPHQCECGKSFTQTSSLAAHRKTHSNTTFYTCSICGRQFKHSFSLKKHLLVHENGTYGCEICHKTLKTKQSLQNHMYRHYNIRNYNCEDCGDTFVTSSELQSHRQKHTSTKKVECNLCGYRTNTKRNLIVHIKRHTGDKSVKCCICSRSFYTAGELRRHRRVHSREKRYPCPACAQRLAHSSSLNKHMRSVHGIRYKWADFNTKDTKVESK